VLQQFCESATVEETAQTILTDEHTPPKFRALLTLANFKPFSDVWNCKEEDKMNAPKKCQFWQ